MNCQRPTAPEGEVAVGCNAEFDNGKEFELERQPGFLELTLDQRKVILGLSQHPACQCAVRGDVSDQMFADDLVVR